MSFDQREILKYCQNGVYLLIDFNAYLSKCVHIIFCTLYASHKTLCWVPTCHMDFHNFLRVYFWVSTILLARMGFNNAFWPGWVSTITLWACTFGLGGFQQYFWPGGCQQCLSTQFQSCPNPSLSSESQSHWAETKLNSSKYASFLWNGSDIRMQGQWHLISGKMILFQWFTSVKA